jgi:putative effector of murein hydrolase LrgA (UPF0299 family)
MDVLKKVFHWLLVAVLSIVVLAVVIGAVAFVVQNRFSTAANLYTQVPILFLQWHWTHTIASWMEWSFAAGVIGGAVLVGLACAVRSRRRSVQRQAS